MTGDEVRLFAVLGAFFLWGVVAATRLNGRYGEPVGFAALFLATILICATGWLIRVSDTLEANHENPEASSREH